METKDGGPAFPVSTRETDIPIQGAYGHQDGHNTWQFGGMTLRDYFAAKAMAALMTGCEFNEEILVLAAFRMADLMIEARNKP